MRTIAEELTLLVSQAAETMGHVGFSVDACVPTASAQHGDYQSNFAFRLGKHLKMNPRAMAQAMVDALPPHPAVVGAEVAGPGFINFRLSEAWLAQNVGERLAADRMGPPAPGAEKTVVIDYSSPNVAKRMHVGHLRSTIIGGALHQLHRFLGWNVVADNHIGDWGTQFGKLIVAWHEWRDEAAYAEDAIAELQRLYVLFGEKAKAQPDLEDRARAETARLQSGDPENVRLWTQFVEVSLVEFDALYQRMGIKFDVILGESFYRDDLKPLVDRMLADGIAVDSDGAVIVPLGDVEPQFAEQPLLVRKSDGAALYGTTDLATVYYRQKTWAPDKVVYVTDMRQRDHFRQVFAACRKMGIEHNFVHVYFGMLRLPDGAVPSSRSGLALNLKEVLDIAVAHARKVVDEKSGHLSDIERAEIAEAVGVGAIRYADLSQNPQTDIVFDLAKMLSLDGNTAPYLMYAHARCKSILRKAADEGASSGPMVLEHPLERELALAVARLPEAVLDAANSYRPNLLCEYLFGLANTFARFYGACRVLGADVEPNTTASRLALTAATAMALREGLGIVGLRALDRM